MNRGNMSRSYQNREIKFRGRLTDNGIWLYGSLLKATNGSCAIVPCGFDGTRLNPFCIVPVDPKTVGQYIGIKDKNDKEIYTGDVCEWEYPAQHYSHGKAELKRIGYVNYCNKTGMYFMEKNKDGDGWILVDINFRYLSRLGTIHDPEFKHLVEG